MGLKFDLNSFDKGVRKIEKNIITRVARPAVEKTAKTVVKDAKNITPVDTGKLRDSLEQETKSKRKGVLSVMSSDVGYALIVHEDLTANHPTGTSKFLSKALLANAKTFETNIKTSIGRLRG